ncbi:MAG: hypothetical protein GOP50_00520 [Candidatus Heimdallarchaeota archaeon]|nr:hypothetical protein [Candidatus Heimdallarchaeota archaeon]
MFKLREFEPPKRTQIAIKNMFIIMAYTLTITLFLAINYYYKRYVFFAEHISNLGSMDTLNSPPNTFSMIIMIVGFGINSALMLSVAIIYFVKRKELKGAIVKGSLAIILAFGATGIAIPLDHPQLRILHLVGAACFIGGFAAFNAYLQITSSYRKIVKKEADNSKADTIWDITLSFIVIAVLVIYFVTFALDQLGIGTTWHLGPIFQKIVVFIEVLALYFIDNKDV